ncbi:hypothetical protein L1887_13690 [Cichorium endivia]|nr:hypothetical protein L1887_13690 [Cichorium endivia]
MMRVALRTLVTRALTRVPDKRVSLSHRPIYLPSPLVYSPISLQTTLCLLSLQRSLFHFNPYASKLNPSIHRTILTIKF